MLSCRLLLIGPPPDWEAGHVDYCAVLSRSRAFRMTSEGQGAPGARCQQGKCHAVGWDLGKSCRVPCCGPKWSHVLQRTDAGLCPSCFAEIPSGLWDLCWYPLKANLRSGVGIKIYSGCLPQFAADSIFFPLLPRHMKIHEKDPNSTVTTTPPSPLKRRRLSSKRKFCHDAEMDREERIPAKKVLYGAWSKRWLSPKLCQLLRSCSLHGHTQIYSPVYIFWDAMLVLYRQHCCLRLKSNFSFQRLKELIYFF